MDAVVKAIFLYDDFWDQSVSTLTGIFTSGEISPISVKGLVDETKQKAGKQKISRLDWYAHGTDTFIGAGEDVLHTYTPKLHMTKLAKLKGSFTSDGYIRLFVCKAGMCKSVMSEMAKTIGISVYANEGDVRPMLYGTPLVISGQVVAAKPDGTIQTGQGVENVFYYSETDG